MDAQVQPSSTDHQTCSFCRWVSCSDRLCFPFGISFAASACCCYPEMSWVALSKKNTHTLSWPTTVLVKFYCLWDFPEVLVTKTTFWKDSMCWAWPQGNHSCFEMTLFGDRGPVSKTPGTLLYVKGPIQLQPHEKAEIRRCPRVQTASTNCKVQMFFPHTVLPAICRPNHNFCGSNFVKEGGCF